MVLKRTLGLLEFCDMRSEKYVVLAALTESWYWARQFFTSSYDTWSLSFFHFLSAFLQLRRRERFVIVGMVDDIQIDYYDSNTKRAEPKQDWMKKVTDDDADYWERLTEILKGDQQTYKVDLDILKRRFNQTGGVHIVQMMEGCEWDDETGDVNGFYQFGYDGEDFIVLDLKTMTWVAAQQQAVLEYLKYYFNKECVDWLKKFVNYGRMSLLQKTPSSRVTCHATGFYPNRAMMFWRKMERSFTRTWTRERSSPTTTAPSRSALTFNCL
uniref:MHC class I-like antigen recognition-like domain-containing protein n=1 Tax=Labrus bergylta TaxID=56723 RepID=A0A3Q3F007_9LABR